MFCVCGLHAPVQLFISIEFTSLYLWDAVNIKVLSAPPVPPGGGAADEEVYVEDALPPLPSDALEQARVALEQMCALEGSDVYGELYVQLLYQSYFSFTFFAICSFFFCF